MTVFPPSRLIEHILGSEPAIRARTLRLLPLFWLNIVGATLLVIAIALGLTPFFNAAVTISYGTAGTIIFFFLLRSGWSARFGDPSLAFPLLLFALSSVVVCYGIVDIARGAGLQLMCLILAFEMDRVKSHRLLWASLFTIVLLASTSLLRIVFDSEGTPIDVEIYNLVMAAVLLPVAIVVGSEIGRVHEQQIQQHAQLGDALQQLNTLSNQDALTGLANRRQMQLWLDEERQRTSRTGESYCVAMLDIDWFKSINDQYGHSVGDLVLQLFARIGRAHLHPADRFARWGGEEFLLLFPASQLERAYHVLRQIHQAVAAFDWTDHVPTLTLSFSAGLSQARTDESNTALLNRADDALYRAKELGRNQIVVDNEAGVKLDEKALASSKPPQIQWKLPQNSSQNASEDAALLQYKTVASGEQSKSDDAHEKTQTSNGNRLQRKKRFWERVADVLLSQNTTIREHLRLPIIATGLHLVWIAAFALYVVPLGQIDFAVGVFAILYDATAMVVFYVAIRSGWSQRFSDPSLVLMQMLVACSISAISYMNAPILRPSLLHLFCVIQVFGMATLTPKESRRAGIVAVVFLLLLLCAIVYTQQPDAILETLKLTLTCYVVIRLALLSWRYSLVRQKVREDKTELARAVEQVQELVIRDALTGLFNRKHLHDLLVHERERQSRTGQTFCIALLDLDYFKKINDQHGHHIGDQVLIQFAKIAQTSLRETDVIGRWGGEEFLILMRDTDPHTQGLRALSRLRTSLAELRLPVQNSGLKITFSAGLADASSNELLQHTLERADRALYRAKAAGRNCDQIGVQKEVVHHSLAST